MEEKIKEIMSEILDVPEESINENFGPDYAELWDSLNSLKMVTAIEEEFDIKLSMEEISDMDDFSKIQSVIKRHLPQN